MAVDDSVRDQPTIGSVVLLVGLPGTGKLAVARELVSLIEQRDAPVRLIDNHYINNVIFNLLPTDGVTPLPAPVWDRVAEVRSAVFETIKRLSPLDWNFVLTVHIGDGDEGFIDAVASLAAARGSPFVPVRMLCDLEELERRVVTPERYQQLKSVSRDDVRREYIERPVPEIDHPNVVTLDVTNLPPADAARTILEKLDGVQ